MDKKQETFTYHYSAKQQEELRQIRQKYLPGEEAPLEQIRRLDKSAARPGTIAALVVGILSTLLLGIGMCCTMVFPDDLFVPGILIGSVGIAGIIAAYPLYSRITKRQRRKLAPEIIKLTDPFVQE